MTEKKPKPRTYEYNKKYALAYDKRHVIFKLRMSEEQKTALDAAAKKAGESINGYILSAVQTRMESEQD